MFQVGSYVRLISRPHIRGVVIRVVSSTYVTVKFENIEDVVGCNVERLERDA